MASRPPLAPTELVEVPIIRYVPIPAALTDKLAAPAAPAFRCTQPSGEPAVCVHDGLMRELEWQAVLARANEDRATAAFLGAGAGTAAEFQPAINWPRLAPPESQLLRHAPSTNTAGSEK